MEADHLPSLRWRAPEVKEGRRPACNSAPQINHSLVRLKGPFLGADLHPGSPGAQVGSKARSGTGATRSEASMARTHPLTRPSTRRKLPSGRVASDQVQLTLLTTYTACGKRKRDAHQKPAPDAIKKRDHPQSVPACSPRSKVILGLDNQHGIYRNRVLEPSQFIRLLDTAFAFC
jgi:hypothetical protein